MCERITSLTAFALARGLEELIASHSGLQTLEGIASYTKLRELTLDGTPVVSGTDPEHYLPPSLRVLSLNNCPNITSMDMCREATQLVLVACTDSGVLGSYDEDGNWREVEDVMDKMPNCRIVGMEDDAGGFHQYQNDDDGEYEDYDDDEEYEDYDDDEEYEDYDEEYEEYEDYEGDEE
ncbi:hypothetical protein STCU_12068 [Strigomonas culicis]|uniref:Uncharacterized protein n=1 Tax=Strigomonas culicis TaxID=28005 RepID=S9TGA1_9TRYP|nr:hypothetical protein STCU_12068 [Strigomonas culicis]|eukprot:EPY15383.1 hypothetical protein STCU_12068 [Strigomonas culicis]